MAEFLKGYKVISGIKVGKPATKAALQRVRYKLDGSWNYRPKDSGPFAVFETEETAREFFYNYTHNATQVWEIEYVKSERKILWKKNPPNFVKNSYGKGYHAESDGKNILRIDECPEGTAMAKAVRFIKRII